MAVTAKSARGAARKPGGAMRRHAQAVLYFQEAIEDQPMPLQLRHETPDDIAAIEAVTVAAFADAPHTSHTEQFIVRALRAANELTLSIVAEEHGQVVGHVALSPSRSPMATTRRPRTGMDWGRSPSCRNGRGKASVRA